MSKIISPALPVRLGAPSLTDFLERERIAPSEVGGTMRMDITKERTWNLGNLTTSSAPAGNIRTRASSATVSSRRKPSILKGSLSLEQINLLNMSRAEEGTSR